MQLGMVGLGRMGANIVRRLMRDGHECVVYDVNAGRGRGSSTARARPARRRSTTSSPSSTAPRAAWVMVPAAFAGDDRRRARGAAWSRATSSSTAATATTATTSTAPRRSSREGIHYVDVGTSGGVFGLERGFCLMIGGETRAGRAPRPDLPDARARRRRGAAHARPHRRAVAPPSRATCTAGRPAPATS